MLEALTPDQFVEARVARKVVPLEDGWKQAGTIAASAHNNFEIYRAIKAGRSQVSEKRWRTPEDFIDRPRPRKKLAEIAVDQPSIDAHQATIESRYPAGKP